ncbi:signal peptidase II [Candidatus Woesearchaeota archaeon]|nr:signal peptidase II [Candidatus Woesearchaeota archaeon]
MALKRWHFLLIGIIFVIDQFTKWLVQSFVSAPIVVFSFLKISFVRNVGVAFGLLQFELLRWFFVVVAVAVIVWLLKLARKEKNNFVLCCISLIIAGAAGNVFDRIFFGFVTDFVDFGFWPAFNVADSALTLGVIGWLYAELCHR